MKTVKTIFLALTVSFSLMTLASCKREGCTNSDAVNYDDNAASDDGSCHFEGGLVFWYNHATSQFLVGDDAASLTFYVNGQVIGSTATNVYWTSEPDCGQNGSISYTKNMGKSQSQTVTYSVVDDTNHEYWTNSITIEANTCKSVQLN
ncbi:MAG: hypothetical protein M0D57_04535 [Sphingobacteriales bacterium JAD_PAG50586_3]|nr:MAG: hypothetical protein M0D57_04535 [Sphingobacteriales bacterium JAD_PAG50586_3]